MYYSKYKDVMCVGVGGGLVYYVALFFHLLGSKVAGFDQSNNQKTENLTKLGLAITSANPKEEVNYNVDLIVYSSAIPAEFIENLKKSNPNAEFIEAGAFSLKLLEDFDSYRLSEIETAAFLKSDIAPLYKLNLQSIPLIGVTGTDGKTTTCAMLYHLLSKAGFRPAVVTTVIAKCGDTEVDTGFHTTTPSAQELCALLAKFKELGCTHIILEITSHALAMGRVAGLKVDVAVFTNVMQDHFDYHKTRENYIQAKSLLLTNNLKSDGTVVLNKVDSKSFSYLSKLVSTKQSLVSLEANSVVVKANQTSFKVNGAAVVLNIPGDYNIHNALSALGAIVGLRLKTSFSDLCEYLPDFKGVEGRMQILQKTPFTVIVDFAHTPNALEKALVSVRKLTDGRRNRVIVVFGCAGNRDSSKRPLMGEVAKRHADVTILTAEDPRTEEITEINSQIRKGWNSVQIEDRDLISIDDIYGIENRRQAIKKALGIAKTGDVVIFCGKGHEKSLCFDKTEYSWNEVEEVKQVLELHPSDNHIVGF